MSPQRGRGRPHTILMDEEAASAPHASHPQDDPQIPLEFLVPPMPQIKFFPPMTFETFQAFTTYWYAQAQA